MNNKRLRDKLTRTENELCARKDELSKLKNKSTTMKSQIQKMEVNEKKMRQSLITVMSQMNTGNNTTKIIDSTSSHPHLQLNSFNKASFNSKSSNSLLTCG
jgi:hypothetical protein